MMRLNLRPLLPTRLVLTVATMDLFLLAAVTLDGVPRPSDARRTQRVVLGLATLEVEYVALDTYWNRRRRLTKNLEFRIPWFSFSAL
jgi:hypothetical protein